MDTSQQSRRKRGEDTVPENLQSGTKQGQKERRGIKARGEPKKGPCPPFNETGDNPKRLVHKLRPGRNWDEGAVEEKGGKRGGRSSGVFVQDKRRETPEIRQKIETFLEELIPDGGPKSKKKHSFLTNLETDEH